MVFGGSSHEARGDNGIASNDPPPKAPYVRPPEPVADSGRLVDEGSTHEDRGMKEAWEAFVETGGD